MAVVDLHLRLIPASLLKHLLSCWPFLKTGCVIDSSAAVSPQLLLRKFKRTLFALVPYGFVQHLRFRDSGWVDCRFAPRDLQRQSSIVHNASVAAVAAEVVVGAHEDTVDRAWFDAQGAEHALCIIDCEAFNPKPFADGALFFFDVDVCFWNTT